MNIFVELAFVLVEFTIERFVMVEVALFTIMGTEVVGDSQPVKSSHACPNVAEVGHTVRQSIERQNFVEEATGNVDVPAVLVAVKNVDLMKSDFTSGSMWLLFSLSTLTGVAKANRGVIDTIAKKANTFFILSVSDVLRGTIAVCKSNLSRRKSVVHCRIYAYSISHDISRGT